MKYSLVLPFVMLFLVLSGCTGKNTPPDMPNVFPCVITITAAGKPVGDVSVSMQPVDGGKWYASGTTNSDGKATMATLSQYAGAAAGDYAVTALKSIPDPNWKPEPEKAPPAISQFGEKFAGAQTTPWKCTVTQGKNEFSFDVPSP